MKPFNLEAALKGEPVVTRDGREVTQLVNFTAADVAYSVYGVVDDDVLSWTVEGQYSRASGAREDLFMKSTTKTGFVNIYATAYSGYGSLAGVSDVYATREAADAGQKKMEKRIACVPISWEE